MVCGDCEAPVGKHQALFDASFDESTRPYDEPIAPVARSIDEVLPACEWHWLSRALAPASPSDVLYPAPASKSASYGPASIIISAKFYLTTVHSASPSY